MARGSADSGSLTSSRTRAGEGCTGSRCTLSARSRRPAPLLPPSEIPRCLERRDQLVQQAHRTLGSRPSARLVRPLPTWSTVRAPAHRRDHDALSRIGCHGRRRPETTPNRGFRLSASASRLRVTHILMRVPRPVMCVCVPAGSRWVLVAARRSLHQSGPSIDRRGANTGAGGVSQSAQEPQAQRCDFRTDGEGSGIGASRT
jgi:hypothetical protein